MAYPKTTPKLDQPALERDVLERWEDDKTFQRSVEQHPTQAAGGDEFVFFDGPPFANGLPHYGHLLTGYVKDVIPRYQTMRGHRVERVFGWDCHGLPAEMNVEKQLEVHGRKAITEFGIDNFNDACRQDVQRFAGEWRSYTQRMARWVDVDNDYKTMDLDYMESVLWAFKTLWDKGLIYQAHRVLPYSWGAQTPLSNFEIRLDDATRPRQDPAVTVAFELAEPLAIDGAARQAFVLAWTTTPWTLPSNLALAVGEDVTYDVVERDGALYILAVDARERYAPQLGDADALATMTGAELVGKTYTPLFDYFANTPDGDARDAFRILGGDFIDTADGTGVVHMAPGFGEDDQRVCEAAGIELVVPVGDDGTFTDEVPDFAGVNVFDANPEIIKALKERGLIVRHDTYEHNYPHCWRTDTPIIYRAMSSWYVEVTKFRDRMVELNRDINWIPGHVQDGAFGKWIEGARDWSISRNRFWGAPIPVWQSDDPAYPRTDVYGSLDEIERDFGVRPDDLHRPYIDDLTRPNPDDPTGTSTMRRVDEVLDCWFESGSMPFASVHYPFDMSADEFEHHYPADFIVEYIAQTRGWFYTLHVLATALFDRPAFTNVMCHGVVLDSEGKKLSKKLRNYPDPLEVMESHGSDALRWFLMSSPILRGGDLRIAQDASQISDAVRRVLNPMWSTFHFLSMYANVDGITGSFDVSSENVLDRYLLAKTRQLVETVTDAMDSFDLAKATETIEQHLDALNNWYVRRSRDRFWAPAEGDGANPADKQAAYNTLHTAMVVLCRVAAPLLPMLTETMHAGLMAASNAGEEQSVHLASWPNPEDLPADDTLVAAMDKLRDAASAGLALREARGLRVRLPLAKATIAARNAEALRPHLALLTDELNVKDVELSEDLAAFGTFRLKPDGKAIGPRLGADTQAVMKAARAGEWERAADGTIQVAGHALADGEYELALEVTDEAIVAQALPGGDAVIALDVNVTRELEIEGLARDVVRAVQQARREADLHVADRITLHVATDDADVREAISTHRDWIGAAVLAPAGPQQDGDAPDAHVETAAIGDATVTISLAVV